MGGLMKKLYEIHSKNNRDKHNQEILDRMKSGDTLQRYTAQASWFPPRPVIKKDTKAIEILYGKKEHKEDSKEASKSEKD